MTQNFHVFAICRRPEIDNDVISGQDVDNVGVDVHIKFGDSRSNRFRDIRGADFVTYERTNERTRTNDKHIPIERDAIAFRLKTFTHACLRMGALVCGEILRK